MDIVCILCNKTFEYPYLLDRHKKNKKPCNRVVESYNCDLCKSNFDYKSHLENHKKSNKHKNNYEIYIKTYNDYSTTINNNNSINIINNILTTFKVH